MTSQNIATWAFYLGIISIFIIAFYMRPHTSRLKGKKRSQENSELIIIYSALDNMDADIVKSLLESHGIPAYIQG